MDVRVCLQIFSLAISLISTANGQTYARVIDVFRDKSGFTQFYNLMVRANMVDLYSSNSVFTVFAFNDTAYNEMPYEQKRVMDSMSIEDTANYVKFCTIYNDVVTTSNIQDNQQRNSMADNNNKLFFNRRQRTIYNPNGNTGVTEYFVNGVQISPELQDLSATKGVVHGMMKVMTITSVKGAYGYIREPDNISIKTSKFDDLLSQLTGEYYSTIMTLKNTDGLITMFVPNDAAMNEIPQSILQTKLIGNAAHPGALDELIKAHFIPNRVLYTSYVNHNEGYPSTLGNPITIRKPYPWQSYVNSERVSAAILHGNISVANGVVHVIDTLLGFVYKNVREQMSKYGPRFNQYIERGTVTFQDKIASQNQVDNNINNRGVNVFVPADTAFDKLANVPGVNLQANLTLLQMMLELHTLKGSDGISITSMVGGYESRQPLTTFNDQRMYVYNFKNESWVQAGRVQARLIRPDVGATNGAIHVIDSVLGIPYLDLANLICHDTWLLRTYDYMRSVGMKDYLTDRRFQSQKCDFEVYGYPPSYGTNTNYPSATSCPDYCSNPSYANVDPCYLDQCKNQQSTTCPTYCTNPQYQNIPPCNTAQCQSGGQVTSCPDYCSLPQYQNDYTCMSCSSNIGTPAPQSAENNMGYCGPVASPCQNTMFVPNSTAIDDFLRTNDGIRVSREPKRFQYLFRRLLFNGPILIDTLANTDHTFTAQNGEKVILRKTNYNSVRISFGNSAANLILMDIGATNGIMHIIDRFLFVQEDLTRDVSASSQLVLHIPLLVLMLVVTFVVRVLKL